MALPTGLPIRKRKYNGGSGQALAGLGISSKNVIKKNIQNNSINFNKTKAVTALHAKQYLLRGNIYISIHSFIISYYTIYTTYIKRSIDRGYLYYINYINIIIISF